MKRLTLILVTFALLLSTACKSESPTGPAANAGATPGAPTPPPGAEEVSVATYQKELEKNPEDLNARYSLGTAYMLENKFLEAAGEFKAVADKKPDDVDALDKMGMAYRSANKFDEAAEAFKRALKVQPDNAYFHQALAEVYEKAGKTDEAAKERAEYQRLDPNVRARALLGAGRFEEAAAEARKVAKANAETHYILGGALLGLKQPAEAVASFREAVRLNPKHANAYFQLGNAYDKLNRQEEAAKAFGEVTRLNPQDADAFYNLGNTYNKLNRPREAAEAFAAAVRLRPGDADARVRLALAQLKQGNAAAARDQQEALKSIDAEAAKQLQLTIDTDATKQP